MKLVVTEKNDAAQKIADLLGATKPKADKVYSTPVYRFTVDGEDWVTIGLRGHILEPDFATALVYKKRGGWRGVSADADSIIIATDFDREGELIGWDALSCIHEVNDTAPVSRAR